MTTTSTRCRALCAAARLALLPVLFVAAAASADPKALPAVLHACDPASPTAAQLGRQAILQSAKADEGALLALTGGAVAAAPGADRFAVAAAMADAAGFDIVNLAHRDLLGDPAAAAKAISAAKAKYTCATFALAEGATPWQDVITLDRAGRKIAVIGLAARAASMEQPSASAMAGLRYTEPKAALEKVIAKAAGADAIIVLADAPLAEVAAWSDLLAKVDLLVVSARGGGAATIKDQPKIVRAPAGGEAVGLLRAGGVPAESLSLVAPAQPSQAYADATARFDLAPAPIAAVEPAAVAAIPSSLEPGKLAPLGLSLRNRAVELTIPSIALLEEYAGHKAPAGQRLLIVELRWVNILRPQVVRDQQVPVQYLVPKLTDHLYCVADDRAVLPPLRLEGPGLLSLASLELPRAGSTVAGRVVYAVPASAPPAQIALRFYDYAHGHMAATLLAPKDGPLAAAKPTAPLQANELAEAGVFSVQKLDQHAGAKAPAGMTYLAIDLRARSQFTYQADASAFDPKAKQGEKVRIGAVADWKESRKYLHVILDGEYAYTALPDSPFAPEPRFLPDLLTGGQAIFCVPDRWTSLELRCDFPNAAVPGAEKIIHPKPLVFALEGKRPAVAPRTAVASIKDNFFQVSIDAQSLPEQFAGASPKDGRWLVLDVSVTNSAKGGEFFQTRQQLKYTTQQAQQLEFDDATLAGPRTPGALMWIPPAETRSFQVAYRIPVADKRPRLAYAGVSMAKVIDLKPIEPAVAIDTPLVKPPQPVTRPVAQVTDPPVKPPQPATKPVAQVTDPPVQPKPPVKPPVARVTDPPTPNVSDPRPATVPARQPKGLAGVGLTAEQVNTAIDNGRAFLWELIRKEDLKGGYEFGHTDNHVLCALALVHAEAHRKFPDFDAALRKYLATVEPRQIGTYQVGLLAMLIESYGDPTFLPKLRQCARRLLEAQGPEGTWDYNITLPAELFADPSARKALRISGGVPLDGPEAAGETLQRITPKAKDGDGDNSVSQFAMLGLHAASRCRLRVPAAAWQSLLDAYRKRICRDGSWAYHATSHTGYGSMTCAGICALAVCRYELGEKDPPADPAIDRGLAWLAKRFSVTKNPEHGDWEFYYLYSLERTGRILNTEFIGEHEWYPLGAKYLVGAQAKTGAWVGEGSEKNPRLATSFALLFLTRATPTLDNQLKRGGPGTLKTDVVLPPGNQVYIILDASGSMLAEIEGKRKFDIAREAVADLIKQLPEKSQAALRVYGHRKLAIDEGADEDTALEVPMAPLNRERLIARLQTLRPRGKTPLALSLEQAAHDLRGGDEHKPITVVLLTDGGEDTLNRRDPVKAAADFGRLKGARLYIVGFDIGREDWGKQLQDMALAAKGRYAPAARADALARELRSAVFGIPDEFLVLDKGGRAVERGKFGESRTLPEGKYRLRAVFSGQEFADDFWINTGATTAVVFDAAHVPATGGGQAVAPPVKDPPPPATQPTSPARPKFCTGCGNPLAPAAKFCTHCGQKVGG